MNAARESAKADAQALWRSTRRGNAVALWRAGLMIAPMMTVIIRGDHEDTTHTHTHAHTQPGEAVAGFDPIKQ